MNFRFLASAGLLGLLVGCAEPTFVAAQPSSRSPFAATSVTGTLRHHPAFPSSFLKHRRDVWVYLPPAYGLSTARYPVLYMHDGNNLFDARLAFGGEEWQVDETCERLIKSGELPPLIVVGVGNTSERTAEYTWVSALFGGEKQGGDGAQYAKFLISELKPFIDATYRTRPRREDTGVMGSSLGGLLSLYLGAHESGTFSRIGAMSPSVWWGERAVLKEAGAMPTSLKLWLDIGGREGDTPVEEVANARELNKRLLAHGFREGENLRYHEDAPGGHDEGAWAYRTPMALKFLFGRSLRREP